MEIPFKRRGIGQVQEEIAQQRLTIAKAERELADLRMEAVLLLGSQTTPEQRNQVARETFMQSARAKLDEALIRDGGGRSVIEVFNERTAHSVSDTQTQPTTVREI